jgi:UDP-3-O-[3-hydroxymyristoyl] glucosamine N-acyltransferase
MLGGNAMISGHLTIADRVVISGGTLVAKSITEPGTYTAVFPCSHMRSGSRMRRWCVICTSSWKECAASRMK